MRLARCCTGGGGGLVAGHSRGLPRTGGLSGLDRSHLGENAMSAHSRERWRTLTDTDGPAEGVSRYVDSDSDAVLELDDSAGDRTCGR